MHKNSIISKGFSFLIVIFLIGLASASSININIKNFSTIDETEYWALLVAVGIYADHPDQNRPSMLIEVDNLHDMLLISEHWNENHIKVIKGESGTVLNMVNGLRWLDRVEDKDDFSLVYITTHGFPLSFDIPPFDEDDRRDEALVSYWGFKYPWRIIWDDLLNLLLSLLESKGVCVVIDSCYSGGFNDPPYFKSRRNDIRMKAVKWMQEFAEDISGRGRVVLMACREDELSYGSKFTKILIEGLRGYADTNKDGIVSAEEAYQYAKDNIDSSKMHPTIYDGFIGELPLTDVELPPSKPETPTGQDLGDTYTFYNYSTVSIDPEGGKISYGWDWDSDYIVDEWTDPVDSNNTVNTTHSWTDEGTYNIRVKAKDERGLISGWSKHIVVIMCSDNIPDQRQTIIETGVMSRDYWSAQSFIPSLNLLSKVELEICSFGTGNPQPLCLYIRDSLSGDNLAESSRLIPYVENYETAWFTFEFEDLDIVPGNTYYIVCRAPGNWFYKWRWTDRDSYPFGKVFYSEDGNEWHSWIADFCFVTWGKI